MSGTASASSPLAAGDAVRVQRALIWVEGPDAEGFLHGLLSNDVTHLAPGESRRALLLDARGRVVADTTVHRDGEEAFTLILEPDLGPTMAAALERYHFSEDLEILGPEPAEAVVTLASMPAAPGDIAVQGPLPGSHEVVVADPAAAIADAGLTERPAAALEVARVLAGVPRVGTDTGPTTLVQEAGLEDVAVSFDKGCYLGQETVARAQFRGRVNRVLRGLRLHGAAPQPGAAVHLGEREVGTLTSVVTDTDLGAVGLAIIRREVDPGTEVAVVPAAGEALTATVADLPFAVDGDPAP